MVFSQLFKNPITKKQKLKKEGTMKRGGMYLFLCVVFIFGIGAQTSYGYFKIGDNEEHIDYDWQWKRQNIVRNEWIRAMEKIVPQLKDQEAALILEYFKKNCILGWLDPDGGVRALENSKYASWIAFVPISLKEHKELFPANPFVGFFPEKKTLFINTDQWTSDSQKTILILFYVYSIKLDSDYFLTHDEDSEILSNERWEKSKKFLDRIIRLYEKSKKDRQF